MNTLNCHTEIINNNSPIGFFDSGVGGLSVYARFKKLLPNENTLYFGDLANLPYGNKTQVELVGFARRILNFYKEKQVKAVVIACNTSSAQAYNIIKDEYDFKIYPIIQSCAKVIASSKISKIGVFATEATVNSRAYFQELKKYNRNIDVHEVACPNWVSIVESSSYGESSAITNIKQKLDEILVYNPEKIILGCTHYPYLLSILEQFSHKDLFIDPAEIFVDFIKKDLETNNLLSTDTTIGTEQMFVSANPKSFVEHSRIFYEVKNLPIVV